MKTDFLLKNKKAVLNPKKKIFRCTPVNYRIVCDYNHYSIVVLFVNERLLNQINTLDKF